MTARRDALLSVIENVRVCRRALARGDTWFAVLIYGSLSRELGFALGCLRLDWGQATCAVVLTRKIVLLLGDQVGAAVQPPPRAAAGDIADAVAQGLRVWRTRDGMDLGDAAINERAANIAMGLGADFDIRRAVHISTDAEGAAITGE